MQFAPVPDDGEIVRTEAVAARLGLRDHGRGSDGRVDRIAAARQHRQPGLCRPRLAGGDDVAGVRAAAVAHR